MYTFVTGALRSGRSTYALRRAAEFGPPPWLYVTAGEETDDAIAKRIARHRKDKEAIWRTAVMPRELTLLFEPEALDGMGALVLDGFTAWLAQRLELGITEPALLAEVGMLAERMYRSRVPIVVVATEMTAAFPPLEATMQRLVHSAASANQILASMAGAVVLMVSGLPLRVR
jgi:adenosylcobinamide kinase / adenosylcobinamide-phosphate guanylyltransferase